MSEDWCAEKLANLRLQENVTDTLNDICSSLKKCKSLENRITAKLIESGEICKYLDGKDEYVFFMIYI